jgi:DNA ligase (NAD+)
MNIVGLSDERLKMLMHLGYVRDFASLFSLHECAKDIEILDGYGKSSVTKLLKSIDESRTCKLSNVLTAIGIPGIGKSSAKSLAKFILSKEKGTMEYDGVEYQNSYITFLLMGYKDYDWTQLSDFGETTSQNINTFVKSNIEELSALVPILDIIDDHEENVGNNKLGGKTFCITGKLMQFANRDALVEEIEKYGGKIVSGVTSKTDYLITNDKESGSSKNQKAIKYGTSIISEEEFIELCK